MEIFYLQVKYYETYKNWVVNSVYVVNMDSHRYRFDLLISYYLILFLFQPGI